MNNTNGEEYKSAYKKAISSLNQALELSYALEGIRPFDDCESIDDLINNIFKKRMNVVEIDENTFSSDYELYACPYYGGNCHQYVPNAATSFITQDGIIFSFITTDGITEDRLNEFNLNEVDQAGIALIIDVNGIKGPNKPTTSSTHPRDQYQAIMTNVRVVPSGKVAKEIMYGKQIETKKTSPKKDDLAS